MQPYLTKRPYNMPTGTNRKSTLAVHAHTSRDLVVSTREVSVRTFCSFYRPTGGGFCRLWRCNAYTPCGMIDYRLTLDLLELTCIKFMHKWCRWRTMVHHGSWYFLMHVYVDDNKEFIKVKYLLDLLWWSIISVIRKKVYRHINNLMQPHTKTWQVVVTVTYHIR